MLNIIIIIIIIIIITRDVEKVKLNVKLDGVSLNRVSSTKFLGVIIDENLKWKNHIDAISKTLSRNIGILTKFKYFVPENILYSLYCTLILPYINYGVLIWGNTCKIYLDKIFKLQKWAIRTISNSHYRSHTGPLFSKFNILNVHDTFKLNLGTFIYRHHSNQLPPIFQRILLNMFKHTIIQQEMLKITVLIKQRKCFLIVQLEIVYLLFGIL